jgi:hypothetical protein
MMGDAEASPYRILISRANLRPLADLYPFNLADPIPSIPMPLQAGDAEPIVNLQSLLMGVYERSGYDYFIDYHSDPSPPLTPEELTWINNVLTQQGRR